MSHPRPGAEYIGDGVYVSKDLHDPAMIWLETQRDDEGWQEIALELSVYQNLVTFAQSAWGL